MESLTTVRDGNGALCASVASGSRGLMGYCSSKTVMVSTLLWRRAEERRGGGILVMLTRKEVSFSANRVVPLLKQHHTRDRW